MRTEPYLDADAPLAANDVAAPPERRPSSRRRARALLLALLTLLAAAALVSVLWQPGPRETATLERPSTATPGPVAGTSAAPGAPAGEARYPVAPTAGTQPPLDMSDATLLSSLDGVFEDGAIVHYLEPANLVRRIVATVDNLPRRRAPPSHWPIKAAAGQLATASENGKVVIAETNGFRYAPYVRLLEAVDTARLVALYRRHYPLFEQAYRELGFPDGHFNDRAVEAIDVLMATPTLAQPPSLVQKVQWQFADRDLEQLPAGQKLMLRIGSDNARRVQAKLADIRAAITDPATVGAR